MTREAYTDGACRVSNPGKCSCAWAYYEDGVLVDDFSCTIDGLNTNNWAEYQGLVELLGYLCWKSITGVKIHCDSKLVVSQVNYVWQVRDNLVDPCEQARLMMAEGGHTLVHVKGHAGVEGNEHCDKLCNEVLDLAEGKETACQT